jgi:hypothetical protein
VSCERGSLRASALAGALLLLLATPGAAAPEPVRLWYVGDESGSAWQGAQQGLAEIRRAGEFAGVRFELHRARAEEVQTAGTVAVVLADLPAEAMESLAATLGEPPIFNLTAPEDRLRERCYPNLFSVLPSARMRADALQQWRAVQSGAAAEAAGWNPQFRKYGARDLNRRFLSAHGAPMDEAAWAGWAAVKIAGEAIMRTGSSDPHTLRAYLHDELSFDGTKGFSLTFRDTGQLRQPVWIVQDGKVVAEAPIEGAVEDPDDLDTLGLAACAEPQR